MSCFFCCWRLCCFPKGLNLSKYPPIHPSIKSSTNPPTEQTQISVEISQNPISWQQLTQVFKCNYCFMAAQ